MEELDLKDLLKLIWKQKLLIILLVIVGGVLGFIYNKYYTTPKYKATTTFLLAQNINETDTSITSTDVTLNSKLVDNYSELIKSDTVLNETLNQLNLQMNIKELQNNITVEAKKSTEFIELSVATKQKELSPLIANKIMEVFTEKVKQIYKVENVHVVDPAVQSNTPYNINTTKYALIGAVIGLVISLTIIFIINCFDDSLKDDKDIEKILGLRTLATFRKQTGQNNLSWNPKDDYVEGFKILRTNLQFVNRNKDIKVISVTSTLPGEGKSWVSANLALAYAKADYKVLLIDGDMRKGTQNAIFNIRQAPGLSDLIKSDDSTDDFRLIAGKYIHKASINNVYIIPSGNLTFDSSELLISNRTNKLLETLKQNFDIIIIDSTPCTMVADAAIISRIVDTTIIVTEYEKTKLRNLKYIREQIKDVGGNIAGIVINKVPSKGAGYYYYYYGEDNSKKTSSGKSHHKSQKNSNKNKTNDQH